MRAKTLEFGDLDANYKQTKAENEELQARLQKAMVTEFSDPASIILQEELEALRQKLDTIHKSHSTEKEQLKQKLQSKEELIRLLELEKQEAFYQDSARYSENFRDEESTQALKISQLEIEELKKRVVQLQDDFKVMEKKYVDAKMAWANSDIEREALNNKYREAQDKLREYSSDYTMMEVELYKLNERFGQTLNNNNELELEVQALRKQLEDK